MCKLWNEFTSGHVFKRRVERMVDEDESLQVKGVPFKTFSLDDFVRRWQSVSNGTKAFMFPLTLSQTGQFTRKCWRKYSSSRICGDIENLRCAKMLIFAENIVYFRPKGYFATVLCSV